jgi:hypothetical protein
MPRTSASQATSTAVSPENLALYEVQKPFVEPLCDGADFGIQHLTFYSTMSACLPRPS